MKYEEMVEKFAKRADIITNHTFTVNIKVDNSTGIRVRFRRPSHNRVYLEEITTLRLPQGTIEVGGKLTRWDDWGDRVLQVFRDQSELEHVERPVGLFDNIFTATFSDTLTEMQLRNLLLECPLL